RRQICLSWRYPPDNGSWLLCNASTTCGISYPILWHIGNANGTLRTASFHIKECFAVNFPNSRQIRSVWVDGAQTGCSDNRDHSHNNHSERQHHVPAVFENLWFILARHAH